MRLFLKALAHPRMPFFILPALMVLVIIGTLAQRHMDVFDAERIYFRSWIIWLGPVPLPGGIVLLSLLTVSLLAKFLFFSTWTWARAGSHLAHLGVLVLLIGGVVSAVTTRDGAMPIAEGETSTQILSYHDHQLVLGHDGKKRTHISLDRGTRLGFPNSVARVTVLDICRACVPVTRSGTSAFEKKYGPLRGMLAAAEFKKAPSSQQQALTALTVAVQGTSSTTDGVYALMDVLVKPLMIKTDTGSFSLLLEKQHSQLPFAIRLDSFTKLTYPGTTKPRAYYSDITVIDNGVAWPARIEMNKPLRYKGYTLFQSSFFEHDDGSLGTVLAVVKNKGWIFPYIGSAIIGLGLLFHLVRVLRRARKETA